VGAIMQGSSLMQGCSGQPLPTGCVQTHEKKLFPQAGSLCSANTLALPVWEGTSGTIEMNEIRSPKLPCIQLHHAEHCAVTTTHQRQHS
jgi:hypothetical protein